VVDRLFRVVKSKLYAMRWCALLAQKLQKHLVWSRWTLQRSSADSASVQQIQD
jgi:hypothetical protein